MNKEPLTGEEHGGNGRKRPHVPRFERLMAKVDRNGGNDCWLWTGGVSGPGYGAMFSHCDENGIHKKVYVHRASWEHHNGSIPEGLQVLHKCDTPLCVNPDHLFLGTVLDNMRDRDAKGRSGTFKDRCVNGHLLSITRRRAAVGVHTDGSIRFSSYCSDCPAKRRDHPCLDCQKLITKGSLRCKSCTQKHKWIQRRSNEQMW